MGQILLGLFAAYILYNFIFKFLIPVIRVTRQVKKQVRDFQQHANPQQGGFHTTASDGSFQSAQDYFSMSSNGRSTNSASGSGSPFNRSATNGSTFGTSASSNREEVKPKKDDYIDFEEIK